MISKTPMIIATMQITSSHGSGITININTHQVRVSPLTD